MTELLGFDRLLPMNTGVEGGESACKIARKWGYDVKKIPYKQAKVGRSKGSLTSLSYIIIYYLFKNRHVLQLSIIFSII